MTNFKRADDSNEYLWDKSGTVDPVVADLESALGPLAYRPADRPLSVPERSRRRWPLLTAAAAAALIVAVAAGMFVWRLQWPAGQAWPMELSGQAAAGRAGAFAVGQTLTLDATSTATIDVARLGSMQVRPGSDVTLSATASSKHRLHLDRGSVHVRVWAPPSRIVLTTPAGEVIDLGCVFTLTVDAQGVANIAVETGWVQLDNVHGEVLVPAGTSTTMSIDRRPLVPVYDDATAPFRAAVRGLETPNTGDVVTPLAELRRDARPRDVPTILVLALRVPPALRAALLEHAATLVPPPQTASAAGSLDNASVWEWFDSLPLPPAKSWWRNWPDAFRK